MKELRPYQQQALSLTWSRIRTSTLGKPGKSVVRGHLIRVLTVMATGLGKTVLASQIARQWHHNYKTRVLFMMHMTDALEQARKEFREAFGRSRISTGILTGDLKENLKADVVFATFQSMQNYLSVFPSNTFGLVMVDEAHHSHAESYNQVIGHFQPDVLYGMTATPDRMDGLDIRDIFGHPVYEYGLADALADGRWLSQVDYRVMTDNIDRRRLAVLVGRVKKGDRQVSIKDIDQTVFLQEKMAASAEIIKREQGRRQRKTIIFCKNTKHIALMHKYFPEAKSYHCRLGKQLLRKRMEDFRKGEIRTLLVVDKLNEAIDIPDAELIVFLRGTESRTIWLQQLGRGLRKAEGKGKVTVLDFVANCRRLMDIHAFNIQVQSLTKKEREVAEVHTGLKVLFTEELVSVLDVLRFNKQDFYPTWEEAARAAANLKIRNNVVYKKNYKRDPRLPGSPNRVYSDVWKTRGGWRGFFSRGLYPTWEEAAKATRKLGIRSSIEYRPKHKQDPMLPSEPFTVYISVWKQNGGWPGFLDTVLYPTWEEAAKAARKLGVKGIVGYQREQKRDPKLPSSPQVYYSDVWKQNGGWPGFLGIQPTNRVRNTCYKTWQEASKAAQKLGIKSEVEYHKRYKTDPKLHSCPSYIYSDVWKENGGWLGFLNQTRQRRRGDYSTWEEAAKAARKLGVKSEREYRDKYKTDPKLPSCPFRAYSDVWKENGGWLGFLRKE